MAIRYAADPPDHRIAIAMEGLTIVHHRPSGQTHILAPPAPELLASLAAGPADAAELAARLAADGAIEAEGDVVATIAARLDEMAAAGLVRAA